MTDVNKNIFEAYKSMYEEKMSPEECIRDTLRKEGGAAGLAPCLLYTSPSPRDS